MNEQVMLYLRKPWIPPIVSGVVGVAIGAAAMYEIQKRKLEDILEETENEIAQLKHEQLQLDFERTEKDREFNRAIGEAAMVTRELTQQGLQLVDTLRQVNPLSVIGGEVLVKPTDNVLEEVSQPEIQPDHKPENSNNIHTSELDLETKADPRRLQKLVSSAKNEVVEVVESVKNIFDNPNEDWDHEQELSSRDPDQPYVIHADEYLADDMGWDSQQTVTWYEGDAILTDHKDRPIHNGYELIGDCVKRFGHGSGDPNIVFVRNEKLQAEYEVIRDVGSYEEVVLGGYVEAEYESSDLKHSRSPRKFRQE
jgi:hypothetical protein